MTTLKFSQFSGVFPKVAKRLLPAGGGQTCNNAKITSGELVTFKNVAQLNPQPSNTIPFGTIYRATDDANSAWMTWSGDVDVVRIPFDVSTEARYAWTGDGCPRYGTYTNITNGGGNDYPSVSYALGIPTPVTGPGVSHSGGVGSTVSRFYCYTFYNPNTSEESGASPVSTLTTGKVDGTWAISLMDAVPPNTGDLSNVTYVGKAVTVTSAVTHYNRVGDSVVIANVSTVTNVNGTWTLTAATATTMTFTVTDTPAGTYNNGTDTTDTWTRSVSWNTSGMVKRLYRSSGSVASLQLVADNISATTYNDTILDAAIPGDDLISALWAPPPADLTCLRLAPCGSLVGVSGNLICLSEPFQPHAWPVEYQFGCDYPLLGVGMSGTDIVGVTSSNPYLLTGTEPSSMYNQKLSGVYPGYSKRSIISDGGSCYFASRVGMVAVSGGAPSVITDPWFAKDEWLAYNPETMYSAIAYGLLFVGYTDNSDNRRVLVFNFPYRQLTTLDISSYAFHVDEVSGIMYVSTDDGICEFDTENGTPMTMEYLSPEVVLPSPKNFGAAKVVFTSGLDQATLDALIAAAEAAEAANAALITAGGAKGSFGRVAFGGRAFGDSQLQRVPEIPEYGELTFSLYEGDTLMFSRTVNSNQAFRLPSGFKSARPSVKVNAQGQVAFIAIAETMMEIRNA